MRSLILGEIRKPVPINEDEKTPLRHCRPSWEKGDLRIKVRWAGLFILCGFILSGFGVGGNHKSSIRWSIDFHPIAIKISDMPIAKNIVIADKPEESEFFSFLGYFGDLFRFKPHVPSLSGTFSRKDGPRCSHSRWECRLRFIGNGFVSVGDFKINNLGFFDVTRRFAGIGYFQINKKSTQRINLIKADTNPGSFRDSHMSRLLTVNIGLNTTDYYQTARKKNDKKSEPPGRINWLLRLSFLFGCLVLGLWLACVGTQKLLDWNSLSGWGHLLFGWLLIEFGLFTLWLGFFWICPFAAFACAA